MKQIFKSKWNTKLLPLLTKHKEVSLYDIVKLASDEYISGTKYLGDFLDYFIYQPDNNLSQEQNNQILKFIETLINPNNYKENSSESIKAFHNFNIKENLSPENYIALHDVYWSQATLSELFIKQDSLIYQFESCFIFGKNPTITTYTPTYYFQDQFSYFEAACLMIGCLDAIDAKDLYEENSDEFHNINPQFRSCFNFLKKAKEAAILPAEIIPSKLLHEYLEPKFHIPGFTDRAINEAPKSYSSRNIHPSIDPSHPHYAPELELAIKVWQKKYVDGYPTKYEDHSPAIQQILKEMEIKNKRLIERITVITNNKKLKIS
ncbi:hypothetical protein E0H80_02135 [Acinetobacter sp. ANC 4779]|uniref:hypothetical protein n=1 Tax=Acinetobacter sp. ANC 4779 TaxID=2529848 RepID=UPI00103B5D73|nr:hypothetical protein [Acinetobacter sp. ANC 4779]TCB52658.1 hypothetical protein E0H80_02135 [Acinetobacter sp. ANC 4779]